MWMPNISKHIIASNKADSSLSPPFSLTLITPFQFPFSSSPLLLCSIYLPPSSHLSINSCSEVSFSFSGTPFSLPFLFPFSLVHIRDDSRCTDIYIHRAYTWKWLKAEMYTVHELILGLNQHIHAVFLDWSYRSPRGLKWKPIKSDIFHFHLHIVTAWWELEF